MSGELALWHGAFGHIVALQGLDVVEEILVHVDPHHRHGPLSHHGKRVHFAWRGSELLLAAAHQVLMSGITTATAAPAGKFLARSSMEALAISAAPRWQRPHSELEPSPVAIADPTTATTLWKPFFICTDASGPI